MQTVCAACNGSIHFARRWATACTGAGPAAAQPEPPATRALAPRPDLGRELVARVSLPAVLRLMPADAMKI